MRQKQTTPLKTDKKSHENRKTKKQEKNMKKGHEIFQKKHCLNLITTQSTIMMKTAMMMDNQMKKVPLNMHNFKTFSCFT